MFQSERLQHFVYAHFSGIADIQINHLVNGVILFSIGSVVIKFRDFSCSCICLVAC